MMFFKILLFAILVLPLVVIQGLIFLFGGWTMDSYSRPNIVFAFLDWVES